MGEQIVGSWNADALADIAQAFGGSYCAYADVGEDKNSDSLLTHATCLLAAENSPEAQSVYGFRPPQSGRCALLLGNEAKGLRRRTLKRVHATIEIPLVSKNINCLNVAAAGAILLYYLGQGRTLFQKKRSLSAIQKERPDVLLIGGADPMELGSTVRSACAFGWEHLFVGKTATAAKSYPSQHKRNWIFWTFSSFDTAWLGRSSVERV